MAIKSGSYQTGLSYAQYRSMNHNPLSAWFMVHGNRIIFVELTILAVLTGVMFGVALR